MDCVDDTWDPVVIDAHVTNEWDRWRMTTCTRAEDVVTRWLPCEFDAVRTQKMKIPTWLQCGTGDVVALGPNMVTGDGGHDKDKGGAHRGEEKALVMTWAWRLEVVGAG